MNNLNTNRTIFWILIFLVLVNLAALATHFFMAHKAADQTGLQPARRSGVALREQLALTDDQSVKVNRINAAYRESSEPVVSAIRAKKTVLLKELSKDSTNINLAEKLADEIGVEQAKLQKANIRQFLELKKVCTPEQTQKLSAIYEGLYGCGSPGKGHGQGKGNGSGNKDGKRYRYGQQQRDSVVPGN